MAKNTPAVGNAPAASNPGDLPPARSTPPAAKTEVEETAPAIKLAIDGEELTWVDESGGNCGFVVETTHDHRDWRVEAELPKGTTRYKPTPIPPSKTDFYRVFYLIGKGRSETPSNVVVIHFL